MKIHVILLIAVAIIMISGIMAEETASSKEVASSKKFKLEYILTKLALILKLRPSIIRRLKNLAEHVLNEV